MWLASLAKFFKKNLYSVLSNIFPCVTIFWVYASNLLIIRLSGLLIFNAKAQMNFQWAKCSFLRLIKRCFRLIDFLAGKMTDSCQNIEVTISQMMVRWFFFSSFFRVLIPKSPVLFPLRLNLWRFHIYPKFCPRAPTESVLPHKVEGMPKWKTIRVAWKVWVRFPRILLDRQFLRQVRAYFLTYHIS